MQNFQWCMRTKIWRWEQRVAGARPWHTWVSGPLSTSPQRIWVIATPGVAFRSGGSWVAPWRVRKAGPVWHLWASGLGAADELPPSGGGAQSLATWSSVFREISDQKVVVPSHFWSSTLSFKRLREKQLPAGSTEQTLRRKIGNWAQHLSITGRWKQSAEPELEVNLKPTRWQPCLWPFLHQSRVQPQGHLDPCTFQHEIRWYWRSYRSLCSLE